MASSPLQNKEEHREYLSPVPLRKLTQDEKEVGEDYRRIREELLEELARLQKRKENASAQSSRRWKRRWLLFLERIRNS